MATSAISQQSARPNLSITLSMANSVVTLAGPIFVSVVEKNIGNEEVQWSTLCDAALDYKFAVFGPDGKPAKPTALMQRILEGHGPFVTICTIVGTLPAGQEFTGGTDLAHYFEMTVPGKYIVQAIRDSVSSNKLESRS